MSIDKVAPLIQEALKKALAEKRYRFGFAKYQGVSNKIASGKLYNSVQVIPVKKSDDDFVLQVIMENYSQWVQSGRLPGKKGVPLGAIEKWIKDRKLVGRDKKGKYIKTKSFAFAIQTNIKKFGIRPSNFLDVAIEDIMSDPKVLEILGDTTLEELINNIEGI
jgi:hypothetical protein